MPDTLSSKLKLRMKELLEVKDRYEDRDSDIARYVNPRRGLIRDSQRYDDRGEARGKQSYTGEPAAALGIWADGMQGHMVSQSLKWFKSAIGDQAINRIDEVQAYLQEYDEAMYGEFNRSNFYSILGEWFRDAGSIGTATLYTEEDIGRGVCVHIPIHPREVFISEDRYGNVDVVFRKFFLTAKQAVQKFGTSKLAKVIIDNAEKHPEKRHEFIHATFPNTDRQFGSLLSVDKPVSSVYLQEKGNPGEDDIVQQSGYDINPYAVWRLRKNSDEIYGYSPAADGMVSIKKLQQMSKNLLKASHMAVSPPLNIPEHMRGHTRIEPDGHNYFERGGDKASVINTGINYPIAIDREDKLENLLNSIYRVDFFLVLARAEREMTATEIMERQAEKAVLLGPQVDRLEQEGLAKVFDVVSDIADKAGRLPEPPQVLIDALEEAKAEGRKSASIDIQYTGPLAQAQRQLFHMRPIKNGLNELAQAAVVFPEVLDRIDPDRLAEQILDSTDFPQSIMRTDAELKEKRDQQALERAQMQAQQTAQGVAEGYAKTTKAPEQGSAAEQAMQQLGV